MYESDPVRFFVFSERNTDQDTGVLSEKRQNMEKIFPGIGKYILKREVYQYKIE